MQPVNSPQSVASPTNPDPATSSDSVPQPIVISETGSSTHLIDDTPGLPPAVIHFLEHPIKSILTIVLVGHSLIGIYEAIKFIFIEMKEYETKLLTNALSHEEFNHVIITAGFLLLSTFGSIFIASRLSKIHENEVAEVIEILMAVALSITNFYYFDSISTLPLAEWWSSIADWFYVRFR